MKLSRLVALASALITLALGGARVAEAIPITHVVVVVQENRSVDNLFNGFSGADTVTQGLNSNGHYTTLTSTTLSSDCDPGHGHNQFVAEANYNPQTSIWGMNGFDNETFTGACTANPQSAYVYVNPSYTNTYTYLALHDGGLADEALQMNSSPSLPAHFWLIGGQAGWPFSVSENMNSGDAGCENTGTTNSVYVQSPYPGYENFPTTPACQDFPVIFDLLDTAGVSWKYYINALNPTGLEGLWAPTYGISHIQGGPDNAKTVLSSTFFTDVSGHTLPQVSYISPSAANSDHPGSNKLDGTLGPKWVKSITDAIGNSAFYWGNTTILIVWDDWGGFYDHVTPRCPTGPYVCSVSSGFRVPLIAVSPYAKVGYIDHTTRTDGAIMGYIESVFGLGHIGNGVQADAQTDNLVSGMFNYLQAPTSYLTPPTPPPN